MLLFSRSERGPYASATNCSLGNCGSLQSNCDTSPGGGAGTGISSVLQASRKPEAKRSNLSAGQRGVVQTCFLVSWGTVRLRPLGTSDTNWPIVKAQDDRWWWVWRTRWNENWQGKPKYAENTYLSATLSTTNPTWLTWARTRAAVVRSRQLTAWAMAQSQRGLCIQECANGCSPSETSFRITSLRYDIHYTFCRQTYGRKVPVCISIYLSIYLCVCLSVCLSVYLSVCLSLYGSTALCWALAVFRFLNPLHNF
jgi:hypothetical protein